MVEVIARTINPRTALAVTRLLSPAAAEDGVTVTIVSTVLLLAAASGVFRHLRVALNLILVVPTVETPGWKAALRGRVIAAALALILGSVPLTADPEHGTNRVRTLVISQCGAAILGFIPFAAIGPSYAAGAAAMVATVALMIVVDAVHPPAVATALAFAFRTGAPWRWSSCWS